jgi:hypothetical protein
MGGSLGARKLAKKLEWRAALVNTLQLAYMRIPLARLAFLSATMHT